MEADKTQEILISKTPNTMEIPIVKRRYLKKSWILIASLTLVFTFIFSTNIYDTVEQKKKVKDELIKATPTPTKKKVKNITIEEKRATSRSEHIFIEPTYTKKPKYIRKTTERLESTEDVTTEPTESTERLESTEDVTTEPTESTPNIEIPTIETTFDLTETLPAETELNGELNEQ